jgi:hypothetical protein
MRFPFVSRCLRPLSAALLLAAGACDDGASAKADGGTDTDTDTDVDSDTDTDSDSDAGPDGGDALCEVDPDRIFDDVAYLASEELAGRLTGSAGNELALQMAEDAFDEIGLVPAGDDGTFRKAFDVLSWELNGTPDVTFDGDVLSEGADFQAFVYSGEGIVTGEVVYVGYGMTVPAYDPADYPDCPLPSTGYDDYSGIDVTGKIALVVRHGPDDDETEQTTCPGNEACTGDPCLWNFSYKAANADLHGAAAMIVVQNYANGPEYLADATLSSSSYTIDFPAVFVDRDIVEASVAGLESWTDGIDAALAPDPHATGVSATISVSVSTSSTPTANVIGAIPGTDPEIGGEVVVVGGHIDHLGTGSQCVPSGETCYGADDNASGAAVTMELARLVTECANPARTILFALWNGEEEGLWGSFDYVADPAFPLESTIAAYSVDMVGAGDDTTLVLYGAMDPDAPGNPYPDQSFPWLSEVMAGSAADMGFEWSVAPGEPIAASDHWPFAYHGVPAVCAMSGLLETHPYYHTAADTIETIGITNLEMSASMMWAGLKPLVEGTEEIYLTSGKALLEGVPPVPFDPSNRFLKDR